MFIYFGGYFMLVNFTKDYDFILEKNSKKFISKSKSKYELKEYETI